MVRLLGNLLPQKKKLYIALTAIYGIGIATSKKILLQLKLDSNLKVSDLNEKNISDLRDYFENEQLKVEGDLRRLINMNIKRLIEINSIRGRRHLKGLPVRGQRTRTNNRTCRKISKSSVIRKTEKK
jgi:small subunit ribosomal protein S13